MTKPVRLQLSRRKGFNLQEHSRSINGLDAVNVARPSKFGNPFTKTAAIESEYANEDTWREFVVECFSDWLGPTQQGRDWWQGKEADKRKAAILDNLHELRGKNLACFCGPHDSCHADILLRICDEVE